MKINWKLRLKNKTTLITLISTVVAFVYQLLAVFDILPSVSGDSITSMLMILINVLAALGIVVDPTTSGMSDSTQALDYDRPKESK